MLVMWLGFFACESAKEPGADNGLFGVPQNYTLTIHEPEYGAFYDQGPVPVSGTVLPHTGTLLIEGEEVDVSLDGSFSTTLEFAPDAEVLVVDVEVVENALRERIPVFAGLDPQESWPGGLSGRILPAGLDQIGKQLGNILDATGWADAITDQLPELDQGFWGLRPIAFLQSPTEIALSPARSGVEVDFTLSGVGIEYEIWWQTDIGIETDTLIIQVETVAIGATAEPILEDDGRLVFSLYDADLTMDNPDFIFGSDNAAFLEAILEGVSQWILEPIAENILETLLAEIGSLELEGPFEFETDLMGTTIGIGLDEIYGDRDGLALEMELAIDRPLADNASYVPIPDTDDAPEDAQLVLGFHEGLLDRVLSEQVLGLLGENLDLSGFGGTIVANAVRTFPGGEDMPEASSYCLAIDPGSASVFRMQEGVAPLGILYLADLTVELGFEKGGACENWIVASMVTEVQLMVEDGSVLGFDLKVAEGALLYYGASPESYEEAEVIEKFGSYLSTMLGLLGGVAEFDLGELLSGTTGTEGFDFGLDPLDLAIRDSRVLLDFYDQQPPGLFALSIDLWRQDGAESDENSDDDDNGEDSDSEPSSEEDGPNESNGGSEGETSDSESNSSESGGDGGE